MRHLFPTSVSNDGSSTVVSIVDFCLFLGFCVLRTMLLGLFSSVNGDTSNAKVSKYSYVLSSICLRLLKLMMKIYLMLLFLAWQQLKFGL